MLFILFDLRIRFQVSPGSDEREANVLRAPIHTGMSGNLGSVELRGYLREHLAPPFGSWVWSLTRNQATKRHIVFVHPLSLRRRPGQE